MMPASGPVPKAAQHCTPGTPPQHPPEIARSAARSTLLTRLTKVHPTAPFEPIQGSQKQKNAPNCNFFAIRDCCGEPKRVSRRKSAANQLIGSQFVLCTDKRGSAIAKKLHEYRDFCFRNGKITITGRILKRDTDERENPSGRRKWRKDSRTSSDGHWAQVQRSCKRHKTSGAAGGSGGAGHTPINQRESVR